MSLLGNKEELASPNSEYFRQKYCKIRREYEATHTELVGRVRSQYTQRTGSFNHEMLEAHLREFFVNPFLKALNWRLHGTFEEEPNLIPEAPVISDTSGTILRL